LVYCFAVCAAVLIKEQTSANSILSFFTEHECYVKSEK
jgi:hypothetical protein